MSYNFKQDIEGRRAYQLYVGHSRASCGHGHTERKTLAEELESSECRNGVLEREEIAGRIKEVDIRAGIRVRLQGRHKASLGRTRLAHVYGGCVIRDVSPGKR